MVTLDAHFVALEMKTGKVIYDIEMATVKDGFAGTGAPLIVNDKVIVGIAGGEFANRGFIDAYDPMTGQRLWRFYTIPAPGEPGSETWQGDIWQRGGGADVADRHLRSGAEPACTGAPATRIRTGTARAGRAPTSTPIRSLALDPDTGTLKWHFQYTPHDTHDWDANEVPVLADLTIGGRPRKVVMMANRNGFFYVHDRATGEFLLGKPFVNTTWAKEIGPDGKPRVLPGQRSNRSRHRHVSGLVRRHELHVAVVRRRPRSCSSSPRAKPARASSAGRRRRPRALGDRTHGRHGRARARAEALRRAARARSADRRRANGRSPTTMRAGPACWRRPAASCSAAITRASSSPPIRRPAGSCFEFQTGAAILRRRPATRSTAGSTS